MEITYSEWGIRGRARPWRHQCWFFLTEGAGAPNRHTERMLPREITEGDYPAIQALHRSVGWPERSMAGWRWLHANPARLETGAPAGWVVDGPDGTPAAHAGNLIQRFRLGDRSLYGASGFSIIVSPAARGSSRSLLKAFASQPGVFARYTFNANDKSQPLYVRHGMKAWPEQTHALKLSWIVNLVPLALGRLLRRLYDVAPRIVSGLGEQLMNDRLGRAVRLALPPGVGPLTDFSDTSAYARFWERLAREGRLLADRSPGFSAGGFRTPICPFRRWPWPSSGTAPSSATPWPLWPNRTSSSRRCSRSSIWRRSRATPTRRPR